MDEPVVQALSPCYVCRRLFFYNPHAVPSITPPNKTYAQREPICEGCMAMINARRTAKGLAPLPIRPGAYEPLPAEQL